MKNLGQVKKSKFAMNSAVPESSEMVDKKFNEKNELENSLKLQVAQLPEFSILPGCLALTVKTDFNKKSLT